MVKPLMLAPPLIFAGLALLFFVGMQRSDPDQLPSTFIGRPASQGSSPAEVCMKRLGFAYSQNDMRVS